MLFTEYTHPHIPCRHPEKKNRSPPIQTLTHKRVIIIFPSCNNVLYVCKNDEGYMRQIWIL